MYLQSSPLTPVLQGKDEKKDGHVCGSVCVEEQTNFRFSSSAKLYMLLLS